MRRLIIAAAAFASLATAGSLATAPAQANAAQRIVRSGDLVGRSGLHKMPLGLGWLRRPGAAVLGSL